MRGIIFINRIIFLRKSYLLEKNKILELVTTNMRRHLKNIAKLKDFSQEITINEKYVPTIDIIDGFKFNDT